LSPLGNPGGKGVGLMALCKFNHDDLCEHPGNLSHECVYIVQEDCPHYGPNEEQYWDALTAHEYGSADAQGDNDMARDSKATYYDVGGIETLDIIEAKTRDPESYILGNILKYACRLQHKGKEQEDARKIRVYAERLEELLSSNEQVGQEEPLEMEANGSWKFGTSPDEIIEAKKKERD